MTKSLLLVAYAFPPYGAVGARRAAKLAKFLPEFGWQVRVLTVSIAEYPESWIDSTSGRDDAASADVHRTRALHWRRVREDGARWLPYLVPAIVRSVRQARPDVVLITCGPFFQLAVTPLLSLWKVPYVLDFRDPWVTGGLRPVARNHGARLRRALAKAVERHAVLHAASIVVVSRPLREAYRTAYPQLPPERFAVVPNGYDPADFAQAGAVRWAVPTLLYAGKFTTSLGLRNPRPLLEAIRLLRAEGLEVCLVHLGDKEAAFTSVVDELQLADAVKSTGPLPYAETLSYCKGADILVVIGGGSSGEQTGKVFDYIGAGRPILALAREDSDLGSIVSSLPQGRVLANGDARRVAEAIRTALKAPPRGSGADPDPRFLRRTIARDLARVLERSLPRRREERQPPAGTQATTP
ncbi:MAG: glycosyltransferase [Candidatus Bipolaricaulota bacterium]